MPGCTLIFQASHVISENGRVLAAVALLRGGGLAGLGPVLNASHASLRDDFEISWPEADLAVDAAVAAGALGARMMGGGFGGSALALVPADDPAPTAAITAAFARHGWPPPRFLDAVPSTGTARRDVQHPPRPDAGRRRSAGGHCARPWRARLPAAPCRRPDPGRLRDGDRAADDGDPPVRRLRPGGGHVGTFHAGTTDNVIPDEASFQATRPLVLRPGPRPGPGGGGGPGPRHRRCARAQRGRPFPRQLPGDGQRRGRDHLRGAGRGGPAR